jgi:hypothetical protein
MGFAPIDAAIGDALSIHQCLAWHEFLCPRDQIALDHDSEDVAVSRGNLCGDIAAHEALTSVVLALQGPVPLTPGRPQSHHVVRKLRDDCARVRIYREDIQRRIGNHHIASETR